MALTVQLGGEDIILPVDLEVEDQRPIAGAGVPFSIIYSFIDVTKNE